MRYLTLVLFLLLYFAAGAQSPVDKKKDDTLLKRSDLKEVAVSAKKAPLPEKQQISLRAPAKVKIDGNAKDWSNNFHAYNHSTDIFYLIANDDDNLYLVVQAIDQTAINRIVGGGITFTVQPSINENDKDAASITYPYYQITKGNVGANFQLLIPKDTTMKDARTMRDNHNRQLGQSCKLIRITGIAGFDTLTSVYNNKGILAVGMFDLQERYTLELRVPLKSLSLSANDQTQFAYHIKLNGGNPYGPDYIPEYSGPHILKMPPIVPGAQTYDPTPKAPNTGKRVGAVVSTPTDFWAEYTLAKAP